jgi:hypothetical protein
MYHLLLPLNYFVPGSDSLPEIFLIYTRRLVNMPKVKGFISTIGVFIADDGGWRARRPLRIRHAVTIAI